MSNVFKKKVEDFVCENCSFEVAGNGYTNHCPRCLWSKHVDIHPGDRAQACCGLMEPVKLEKKGDIFRIVHLCNKCGHEQTTKSSPEDDLSILIG
ncbi:MAG: RNHCP domain-containing protein [Parcubacteria group bacterium]|nr:RNHCP domain-containing protein [Parcubacteria group bacterium]